MGIAFFGMSIEPRLTEKIKILIDLVALRGEKLYYYKELYSSLSASLGVSLPNGTVFSSHEDLPEDTSLFLALGGDGTFLNSLAIVRGRNIPVAGINFGRLGFLTTAKVSEGANPWIDLLLERKYDVLKRSLLKMSGDNIPADFYPYALNEISIQRKMPYMMAIDLKINSETIPTYWADGLLVSTSTGSTAYSLSVGGPIVTPGSDVFIITPIAPHNLNVRPLIVPDSSILEITVHPKDGEAVLSADNRSLSIVSGQTIRLSKGEYQMNNVRFSKSGFFEALKEKLLWGEDKRNNS